MKLPYCCIVVFLLFILMLSSPTRADTPYLVAGSFTFPTDGSEFQTPKPLAPYKTYRIQITSPYGVGQLQYVHLKNIAGFWMPFAEQYDRLSSGVLFDGEPADVDSHSDAVRDSQGAHIHTITYLFQGKGDPLTLRTVADFSAVIKQAQIEIALQGVEPQPPQAEVHTVVADTSDSEAISDAAPQPSPPESWSPPWLGYGSLILLFGFLLFRRQRLSSHDPTTPSGARTTTEDLLMKKDTRSSSFPDLSEPDAPLSDAEGLPTVGAPQRNLARSQQEELQGFWASLFDPRPGLQDKHTTTWFRTELETETTLHQMTADAAVERATINKETVIQDHKDKAQQWLATMTRKNQAQALHKQYGDFVAMLERVEELRLDPLLQKQFVGQLFRVYFGEQDANTEESSHE